MLSTKANRCALKRSSPAMTLLIFLIASLYLLSFSNGRSVSNGRIPPVRAVNLGGWLVTEGWIKPSLFDGIPNKDLLDGTQVQLKSVKEGTYLSAKNGGGSIIHTNATASISETFILWRIDESSFNFRVFNKQFVGLNTAGNGIDLVAIAKTPSTPETFQILRSPDDPNRVRIKASNGYFLQVKTDELVSADYKGNGGWGDNDPSVFLMNITASMDGEYQVTNGHGPLLAPKVMKEHWRTFIVEEDFKFIKKSGLNAVRLPVGWWTAYDPNPPKPYVGGSLQAVDNAFLWAEKYGIKVILDLHAAPGSQNVFTSRDGFQEWGQSDYTIQQTVDILDFFTARYAKSPSLFAVELLNEPLAPGAFILSPGLSVQTLSKFYKSGYEVVRKHSQTAYVILSNRIRTNEEREFFSLAKGMTRAVIDVHFYNLFSEFYANLTIQQNIDYIYENRAEELRYLTTPDGPLIFVGEWTGEFQKENVTKEEYQRYVKAQQQVYETATFGWAYWTLKNVRNHWSLEWMVKNGYMKI